MARLPRSEGRRTKPYKDTVGKWTVGVGHNISDNGLPPKMVVALIETGQLTDAMVDELLALDAERAIKDANSIPVYGKLNPVRQSVLADMVFNMGLGSVLGFVNTLAAIDQSRWKDAAQLMLKSKWADQVGGRAIELARLMESGEAKPVKAVV
jgi:lysozyme